MKKKKNIFDIINAQKYPLLEIGRIDELLNKDGGVYVADEIFNAFTKGTPVSAIKYIDDNLFKSWKQRGTCIDCDDFQRALDIAVFPQSDDELTNDFILVYCEYAANRNYLAVRLFESKVILVPWILIAVYAHRYRLCIVAA